MFEKKSQQFPNETEGFVEKRKGRCGEGELNKRNYFKPRFQSDARLDVLLKNYKSYL